MKLPVGITPLSPVHVFKQKKSLYGLRHASRQWYAKLTTSLSFKGFTHSLNDYSLFFKKTCSSISIVAVYVDDILLTRNDDTKLHALKQFLHQEFRIKDLGFLHFFLGMEVIQEPQAHRKFTLDLLHEFESLHLCPASSPLDSSIKLFAKKKATLKRPNHVSPSSG